MADALANIAFGGDGGERKRKGSRFFQNRSKYKLIITVIVFSLPISDLASCSIPDDVELVVVHDIGRQFLYCLLSR